MKRVIVILSAAFLALSVISCKSPPLQPEPPEVSVSAATGNSDKQITLLFATGGAESDWRMGLINSMKSAAIAEGWEFLENYGCEQENQIIALRGAIALCVDYIVLTPATETGWDQVMKEVRDAEIPVIMIDRNINMPELEDYYVTWIGANFIQEGEKAGRWLIDYMDAEGRSNDEINIVELQGTVGSYPAIDRKIGFESVIKDYPNYKITQSQTGDFETELGKEVMESFIVKAQAEDTPIDVLFAHNDGMAIGAIQAIKEAGLIPGKDIIIISIDAVKLAFQAIVAGEMNVTVECSPLYGAIVVDVIKKLEAGEVVPKVIHPNTGETDGIYDEYFYHNVITNLPSRVY